MLIERRFKHKKTSEWNRQQEEHFVRGKRKMGICKVEN